MDDNMLVDFKRELAALAAIRDELKLKAHLARAEAKAELEQLEKRWRSADEQLQRAKTHAKQDASSMRRELKTLLADLKQGYQNVRRSFESP